MIEIKKILKIGLPLVLSVILVWLLFRNQDVGKILDDIKDADYSWILLSYLLSMVSHAARASRWRQLYLPIGYKPSTFRVLLALMFGYFMNVILPRAGEISRCGLIRRTDKVPFEVSIGTVVAERAFDVLSILVLILVALSINFRLFSDIYFSALEQVPEGPKGGTSVIAWLILLGLAIIIALLFFYWRKVFGVRFVVKFRSVMRNVGKGVMSIRKVENKPLFFFNTLIIWVMYFFMSYVVFFSIPSTSHLGYEVGLAVLVVSGIAMIVPVQGGIGAYHLFISTTLIFFGLTREDGLVYATLMHASQLVLYIVGGGISFIIAVFLSRNSEKRTADDQG